MHKRRTSLTARVFFWVWLAYFACLFCTVAYADPITILVAVIANSVGWITATQAFIMIGMSALNIGLSFLEKALSSKPKTTQDTSVQGVNGTMQVGGIVPRSFIAGNYCTAGSLVYVNTWGQDGKTPNAFLTLVIALSDMPVHALTGIYINDTLGTYSTSNTHITQGYAIPEFHVDTGDGEGVTDHVWVDFFDGTQTTVCSWLNSLFGGDANYPYDTDRVGYGIAYAAVTCKVNSKLFSGFPRFKFVLEGVPLYDQREDSTADGSGSQNFDDQSTWAYSTNPVTMMNNILRGFTYNGVWQWGLQNMSRYRVPSDSWFAAMNECDALITQPDGTSTAAQYQFGAEIAYNMLPSDILQQLTTTCNTRLAECGGIYKVHTGAAGTSILSITDDDIIIDQQQQSQPNPSIQKIINGVTSQFADPSQAWSQADAPARYDSVLEAIDGQRLVTAVNFPIVVRLEQVQRLQKSIIAEARKWRTHTFVLPPEAWLLEPNDVIDFTSNRYSYSVKLFRVDAISDMDNCCQQVTLVECDPADYDWTYSSDYIARSDGSLSIVTTGPASQNLGGFTVAAVQITGNDGRKTPAIRITWDTDVQDVDGVQWEIRVGSDTGAVASSGTYFNWTAGTKDITDGIEGLTDYVVRARYWSISGRAFTWTDWSPVTTAARQITTNDLADALLTFGKFANSLTPVQQVDNLADAVTSAGVGYAVLTTDGLLYKWDATSSTWVHAVNTTDLTGEIDTSLIADAAVTTAKIDDAAVEAAKLATNAVTSPAIAAGAVIASKMFIGSTDNLILDGDCQDLAYWQLTNVNTPTANNVISGIAFAHYINAVHNASGESDIISDYIPCTEGLYYHTEMYVYMQNVAGSGYFGVSMIWYAQDKSTVVTYTGVGSGSQTTASTWLHFVSSSQAPTGARYMRMYAYATDGCTGNFGIGGPFIRKMAEGSLVVDGAITTNKLDALAVTADKLAANSVVASKVSIGSTDNLILDGQCIDPHYWEIYGTGVTNMEFLTNDTGFKSTGNIRVTGTGGNGGIISNYFGVEPGRVYRFSTTIYTGSSGYSGTAYLYASWYDINQAFISNDQIANTTGTSYQNLAASPTVPSNACYGRLLVYWVPANSGNSFYIGNPYVRIVNDGQLIVDGSVSADKLAANSVTAGKIAANAVTAGAIEVGAVNAGNILVNNIIVTGHLVANTATEVGNNTTGSMTIATSIDGSVTPTLIATVAVTQVYDNSPIEIAIFGHVHGTVQAGSIQVWIERDGTKIAANALAGGTPSIEAWDVMGLHGLVPAYFQALRADSGGGTQYWGATFTDILATAGTRYYNIYMRSDAYYQSGTDGNGDPIYSYDTNPVYSDACSLTTISYKR